MRNIRKSMTLTRALWPPFPRPYWPQCVCSEVCETDDSRRLRCQVCGQLAERALPVKLTVGEEACAAIERAERLTAQLTVLGFRAELTADGALLLADVTPLRRHFAKFCPAAYCFAVLNAALDIDLGFVPAAVSRPSEKRKIARDGCDRFVAEGWAEKARAQGWSKRELFALPECWSRIDQCGVAWLIGERRVIEVTEHAITIETASGARLGFYRRTSVTPRTSDAGSDLPPTACATSHTESGQPPLNGTESGVACAMAGRAGDTFLDDDPGQRTATRSRRTNKSERSHA
jgi:hypothetical protein